MKYEIVKNLTMTHKSGVTLYRIRAVKDFTTSMGDVKAGALGGWVEKDDNLNHSGNCWIYDDAVVMGEGLVHRDGVVYSHAEVSAKASVGDRAQVGGNARVTGGSAIKGNTIVRGNAYVETDRALGGYGENQNIVVEGDTMIRGSVRVQGNVSLVDKTLITGNVSINGTGIISNATIGNGFCINGQFVILGGEITSAEQLVILGGIGLGGFMNVTYNTVEKQVVFRCGVEGDIEVVDVSEGLDKLQSFLDEQYAADRDYAADRYGSDPTRVVRTLKAAL